MSATRLLAASSTTTFWKGTAIFTHFSGSYIGSPSAIGELRILPRVSTSAQPFFFSFECVFQATIWIPESLFSVLIFHHTRKCSDLNSGARLVFGVF